MIKLMKMSFYLTVFCSIVSIKISATQTDCENPPTTMYSDADLENRGLSIFAKGSWQNGVCVCPKGSFLIPQGKCATITKSSPAYQCDQSNGTWQLNANGIGQCVCPTGTKTSDKGFCIPENLQNTEALCKSTNLAAGIVPGSWNNNQCTCPSGATLDVNGICHKNCSPGNILQDDGSCQSCKVVIEQQLKR